MAFDDGVKTVSGSIAHTDDAAAKVPFVSVKCGIEPTLTGVTEIDVVRPDGNILQTVATSKTQNGITWTVNADGSVTLEGTSTARTYLYVHLYHKILPKDATLTVSVEGLYDNGASDVFLNLPYSDNGTTYSGTYGQVTWGSPKKTISYTADKYLGFLLDCPANVTTNQTVKIMVTIGSDAKAFEPYASPVTYNVELPKSESLADFASNINSSTYNVNVESIGNGGIRFYGQPSATYLNLTTIFDWSFSANKTFTMSRSVSRGYRCYVRVQFADDSVANVIIESNTTSVTYTTTKDIKNIRLDVSGLSTSTTYDERIYVMIQEGSASTPYFYLGGSVDIITGDSEETYAKDSLGSSYLSTFNSDYIGYESSTAYFGGHPSVWLRNWHYQDAKARQTGGIGCLCNYFPVSMHNTSIFASQYRIYFDVDGKNISSVSDFISYVANIEQNGDSLDIVYELSTPLTYNITPREIETIGIVNNVYCNTGDTEVTYYDNAHGFSEVTVTRCGKNLIDKSQAVFGSINASTGGDINSSTRLRSPWIKLNPSTQYTLSTNNNTLQVYELYQYTSDKTKIRSDRADAQSYTFTTTATTVYMRVIFRHADNSAPTLSELDNTQLELGSQATEYEPYEAVSKTAYLHKVIYGGQADVIRGTCEPKNLFDDSTFPRTATDNTYYAQFQANLAEGNKYKIPTIHIEPDVAYVLSFDVECDTEPFNASVGIGIGSYSRDIANANNNTSGRISVPFTLTSALKEQYGDILSFRVPRYSSPREFTFTISNVQLEKASSASEYAPHFDPFTFPPISMSTDEGENTLFANEGASAITYRKETD